MIDIRFCQDDDLESLVDLLTDMSRHYNGAGASEPAIVRRNLVENILGIDSDVRVVVAVEARTVVGVAMIAILYPAPKERAQLFMKELYVASSRRSTGTGEALMRWIARYALVNNCVRFDWTRQPACDRFLSSPGRDARHRQDLFPFHRRRARGVCLRLRAAFISA